MSSIKTFDDTVCFRNLQKRADSAIALFGDKGASGIVLMRPYKDYYEGYTDSDGEYHQGYQLQTEKMPMAQVKSIVFRYIMTYYNRERIYNRQRPGRLASRFRVFRFCTVLGFSTS